MAACGYKATRWGSRFHVRLRLTKRLTGPIAAAHHDLSIGYVSFAIPKRKKLAGADFVAL
jgi:hypothetical protein